MADNLKIYGRFASDSAVPNIDAYYGPYTNKQQAIDRIVGNGSNSKAANGLTIGVFEDGKVVDYVFQNIISGTSPTVDNLIKKISNATITIQQEGQQPQTFTLNQGDNVTITLSKGVSTWDEITGKPVFAAVATSGSYNDLSNKPTIPAAQVNSDWNSNSGVSQILNKPSNLVYFD